MLKCEELQLQIGEEKRKEPERGWKPSASENDAGPGLCPGL